jgi:hypothetical protein
MAEPDGTAPLFGLLPVALALATLLLAVFVAWVVPLPSILP